MVKKLIEKRRRGFFGYVMLTLFWGANLLMLFWLFSALAGWGEMNIGAMNEAEKAGAGIGMAIGLGLIFFIWAAVGVITGLLAYMTRGRKEITEIDA